MKVQRFKWNCRNKSTFPWYSIFLERVCMSSIELIPYVHLTPICQNASARPAVICHLSRGERVTSPYHRSPYVELTYSEIPYVDLTTSNTVHSRHTSYMASTEFICWSDPNFQKLVKVLGYKLSIYFSKINIDTQQKTILFKERVLHLKIIVFIHSVL